MLGRRRDSTDRGWVLPGRLVCCLQSIMVADTDRTHVIQGPRAATGFCGMGTTPGSEFGLCLYPTPQNTAGSGARDGAGGKGCPRFGGRRHCRIPTHGYLLCVGMRDCVPWMQTKGHYFFMRCKPPKMPQQAEQVAAMSSNSRLQTSPAPKVFDESHCFLLITFPIQKNTIYVLVWAVFWPPWLKARVFRNCNFFNMLFSRQWNIRLYYIHLLIKGSSTCLSSVYVSFIYK